MPTKSIKKLEADALRASRLNETMNTNGWPIVMEIITEKYSRLLDDLLRTENPEARGGINAITEIMSDISRDLKFGEVAQEQYRKRVLNGGV